jgi:predicted amidohydrolase
MLTIATCQFPVGADIRANGRRILRQMREAKALGADAAHFPEGSLGGYAGFDFPSFRGYDWPLLRRCTERVLGEARTLGLWVILGSNHPLTPPHKPHNSLYLIDPRGRLADRYDKMFCMGREGDLDLRHYSPGTRFAVFTLRGFRCALLICHDWRYPEVYRECVRRGVRVVFQSWYDGGMGRPEYARSGRVLGSVIPATVQGHAACNHLWISAANTSKPESCFGAFAVRPDGWIAGRLPRNRAGILITRVDPRLRLPDPSAPWRGRAISGVLHSGTPVRDPRSRDRESL